MVTSGTVMRVANEDCGRCEGDDVAHDSRRRAGMAPGRGNRLGPGRRGLTGLRRREGLERRRAARRRGDDHQDRHRHRPDRLHGRRRRLCVSEPAGRPVHAEGRPAGVQHLRAGRHRPAGQHQPHHRRGAGGRQRRRAGHGGGELCNGRDAIDRRRPGHRQPAGHGDPAERPSGDRADLPLRASPRRRPPGT